MWECRLLKQLRVSKQNETKKQNQRKSKTGKKTTLHYSTHRKRKEKLKIAHDPIGRVRLEKWQMASLLWVYRYIDIDIVYVHSTVYLWKNMKTLAIIKWLHHANRISFLKPLETQHEPCRESCSPSARNNELCFRKTLSVYESGFLSLITADAPAVSTETQKVLPCGGGDERGMEK